MRFPMCNYAKISCDFLKVFLMLMPKVKIFTLVRCRYKLLLIDQRCSNDFISMEKFHSVSDGKHCKNSPINFMLLLIFKLDRLL